MRRARSPNSACNPFASRLQADAHGVRLLKLLVDGHSYKTAAAEPNSNINTVAFHVRNIDRKLQVHSKSEAVVKAMRAGLV